MLVSFVFSILSFCFLSSEMQRQGVIYHLMQELENFHAPNGELQFESQIGGKQTKPTSALSVVLNQWVGVRPSQ